MLGMPWWRFWDRKPVQLSQLETPESLPEKEPQRGIVAMSTPLGEGSTRHPGWGLTSESIRGAFVQAETGCPAMQNDIFEDVVERDAHLRSQYESRIKDVAGKAWIIQAGGDDQADVDAARQLELALREISNVHHAWQHLLTATFNGYAPVEVDWKRINGVVVPVKLACVPHRRIVFDAETDEPRLLTRESPFVGETLQPGKWIFASVQHRKTVRAGLLRTAVWWSWLKSLSLRDWQIFCARFGIPFVLATYTRDTNEEGENKAREAILAFGRDGGAMLPDGVTIDVKEPAQGNNSSVHPAMVEMCDRQISKLILGGTLTSDQGTTGSYNQGLVHAAQQFARTMSDDAELGNWVSTQLGASFVRFNGLRARPPRLKHRVVPEVDPIQRMTIYKMYLEMGGELDDDQLRDEFDLKRPSGKALRGLKAAAPAGAKSARDDAAPQPQN